MNQKEWKSSCKYDSKYIWYNKVKEIQRSLQYNPDHNAVVIHHLRDTEEQRKYNDEHYELWGHNLDSTFEYGKYVIFVTKEEHTNIHKHSEETRNKIRISSKKMWQDNSFKEKMIDIFNLPENREMISRRIRDLWQNNEYRNKVINSHTDEFIKNKSSVSASNWQNDEYRNRVTSAIKEKWRDSIFRNKMLAIFSSTEHRKKLSDASKRMWKDDNYRNKIVESSVQSWLDENYRTKVTSAVKASWTDERRAEYSEKFKGKNNPMYGRKGKDHPAFGNILSDETRERMRASWTDERKRQQAERMSGENNYNYGLSLQEDIKARISNTLKEYFKTHDNPMSGKHHSDAARKRMSTAWTDERKKKHKELNEERKFMYNKYKSIGGNLSWHKFISLLCKYKDDMSSFDEEEKLQFLLNCSK